MIAEITPPPVEAPASRPKQTIAVRMVANGLGMIVSTTAVGMVMGAIGSAIRIVVLSGDGGLHLWVISVAALSLAYGLHELTIVRLPVPQRYWQVPAGWSRHGKVGQLFLYGIVLGADIFTLVPFPTLYVLTVIEAGLGVQGGATLGVVYGIARLLPTLLGVISASRQYGTIAVMTRIVSAKNVLRVVDGVALVVVSEVLIGMLCGA